MKQLGGAASIGLLGSTQLGGTAMAAGPLGKRPDVLPDPNFNSGQKQEVLKFVSDSFEATDAMKQQLTSQNGVSRSEAATRANETIDQYRPRLLGELSDRQRQAIGDVMEDAKLVVHNPTADSEVTESVTNSEESADCSCWQFHSETGTLKAALDTPVGNYHAFTFEHRITWEANHSWPADVRAMNATASGDAQSYVLAYWNYQGATPDDITEYTNYFISEKTGTFEGCLFIGSDMTCSRDDKGYIMMSGSAGGNGSVADKSVNPS